MRRGFRKVFGRKLSIGAPAVPFAKSQGSPSLRPELSSRPMLEDTVVRPEQDAPEPTLERALIDRIAMAPKDVAAYEELGDYYLKHGNLGDAKACYRQVLKFSPVHRMVKIKVRRLEKLLESERRERS